MKHAIVTGASGFIGTHLCAELLDRGVSVSAICREGSPNNSRLPREVNIVYTPEFLPKADVFYHLAWEDASGAGRGNPVTQARNAGLALNALQTACDLGCGRFVALGTVYEKLAEQILLRDGFSAADFYILSKKYAHEMTDKLALKLGMKYTWTTICHPIGRHIKPEQMMAYTVSSLLRGNPPSFGPAETPYDIVAVEDVALGLYLIGASEFSRREYYIGGGSPKVLREYLEDARRVLDTETPLKIGQRPDDGLRFQEQWFDIAPLADDTGYKPRVSFAGAVENVARWIKEQ